jgi:hypothetical protein
MSASEYVVLKKAEGGWNVVKKVEAASTRAAIHAIVDGSSNGEGEYAAVPARSWSPIKVKYETKLKLG